MKLEEASAVRCPRCQQFSGREERFAAREGEQVRVIVQCAGCRHRWSIIRLAVAADGGPNASSDR